MLIRKTILHYRWVVAMVMTIALSLAHEVHSQTVLLDDFNRANNNAVANNWTEIETAATGSSQILSNVLRLGSNAAGRDFIWQDVSANYNTVFNSNSNDLTWAFNFRQTRTDPSGFDASNYGMAFVLGSTSTNFLSGNGYAVVLGGPGSPDNVRLVRFAGGLLTNTALTTIIGPITTYTTQYLAVKVTYNPNTGEWSLFTESNNVSFTNPAVASFTQIGSTIADNTYTSSDLMNIGCFWNHNTVASDFAYFDNIYIPSACTLEPEPIVSASSISGSYIGANSVTLDWTSGDGSQVMIVAQQGAPISTNPLDGISYTSSSVFGNGNTIGSGQFIVYMGSGNSATITGLTSVTNYYFAFFEFNGSGCTSNFFLPSSNFNLITDACVLDPQPNIPASAIIVSNALSNSLQVDWLNGNGTNCIVVCSAVNPVTAAPTDGVSYYANSSYGLGTPLAAGQYVIYNGTGTNVLATGLAPSTTYYFSIFTYNGTGCNSNFLNTTPPSGSGTTIAPIIYNHFFGNLHSHSDYSDGDADNICNGANSAYCCYSIANTALNFDFQGISDHNHNEGPVMTPVKYASGIVESVNYFASNPDFASLYGMEWGTISTGGHVNVYGINQLVGWNDGNYDVYCAKGDYNSLLNLIASTPNAFGMLSHPNNSDFGNLLSIPYNAIYDNAIVSSCVKNGPAFSSNTTYSDPAASDFLSFFNKMLSKGYHLGPTADMDNHNSATMGRSSQQRTVVLANALSPSSVRDAMINMRFYASEDYNTHVSFTANNLYPMGSILSQVADPLLDISYSDNDGENASVIKIYYGVPGSNIMPALLTSVSNSNALSFTHVFASGTYYYYAEITQMDGNRIWTSPIWYTKIANLLPVELISFSGENTPEGNLLKWTTLSEINNDYFELERSEDGELYHLIATLDGHGTTSVPVNYQFIDKTMDGGINYYRLRQTDFDGKFSVSTIIAIESDEMNRPFLIYPNPSVGDFTISFNQKERIPLSLSVYNTIGQLVYQIRPTTTENLSISLNDLSEGVYSIVVDYNGSFSQKNILLSK